MAERPYEHAPTPTPDRAPRANPIVDQPATVQACARDYAQGADVRANLTAQEARTRR